jgi:predicted dehydrogenase
MHKKLRLGMIGGGNGAFIGAVHRIAARMDNEYDLVCGAFSSDPAISRASGEELGIASHRVYDSYAKLFKSEKNLPDAERIDVVAIVTPNHLHFEPAKLAMESGFNVIMDKPITINLQQANELKAISERTGKLFCLTHTYTGYPMVKEARHIIGTGQLGAIRKIYVEYPQGWLSTALETTDNKQAKWRSNPDKSGIGGALGDIGTHAFNLAEYVSGLQVTHICADINKVVDGRLLDDDATVLLKFSNGASGILFATQVAAGEENNISIRVYGEKGGLHWQQNNANSLAVSWKDKPQETFRAGNNMSYLSAATLHNCRTPAGHPEGYLEAFANHYRNFALTVRANRDGVTTCAEWLDYPGIEEGIRGMAFIETAVNSGNSAQKWLALHV